MHGTSAEKGRPVLVISDRYPPDTVGGAEVSLQLTLNTLRDRGWPIVVAALSHEVDVPRVEQVSGITVHRIPYPRVWPPQLDAPVGSWDQLRPFPLGKLIRFYKALCYLLSRGKTDWRERLGFLLDSARLVSRGLNDFRPHIDRDMVAMSETRRHLKALIADVAPRLVHADNLRSMLYAADVCPEDVPLVGLVRDNRFLCPDKRQRTRIEERPCRDCTLGCLDNLPERERARAKRLYRENARFRHTCLQRFDAVTVTSVYLGRQVAAVQGVASPEVVANSVDATWYRDVPVPVQADSSGRPEILVVGMMNENKGQDHVVSVMPRLLDACGDLRVVFAGQGTLEPQLRTELERLGIADKAEFCGYLPREALKARYLRASLVVCPSLWPEPFGRVPLEAGALGKPVVAYASGGLMESVLDGTTGLLAAPGDREALANQIIRLLTEPELASRLGEAAAHHVRQRYTVEQVAMGIERVWCSTTIRRRR